jgi:hypothetical protein
MALSVRDSHRETEGPQVGGTRRVCPLLADAEAKELRTVLLWDRVRPAVEWSVRAASANAGFEEMPLRTGPLEGLHRRGVDSAVVVVGRLEPNDHVPLSFVVANARNVTALFNVFTREGVK